MWALGVIVVAIGAAGLGRFLYGRDNVAPMERHLRALEALRGLAEHPDPRPDLVVQPESTTDHVRILEEVPAGAANTRRRSRRATNAKTARLRNGAPELPTIRIPTVPDHPALAAVTVEPIDTVATVSPIDTAVPAADGLARPVPSAPARSRVGAPAGLALAGTALVAIAVVTLGFGGGGGPRVATTTNTTTSRAPAAGTPPAPTTPSPSTTPTTTRPTTVVAATPTVARTSNGATVTVHRPFHLTLRATGTCWVAVTDATGASLFTATMQAGQVEDIPDAQTAVVRLGYTPAMTILVDGVALDLGPLAQTANVDFQTA